MPEEEFSPRFKEISGYPTVFEDADPVEKPGQGSGEEVKNARVQERSAQKDVILHHRGSGDSSLGVTGADLEPVTDEDISKSLSGVHIGPRRMGYKRNLGALAGPAGVQSADAGLKTSQELDLPSSVQPKVKLRKKRELLDLPSSVQISPKQLLPTPETGSWWECPANDEGWQLKLRWRDGEPPYTYVFARVGKNEFQTWKELPGNERNWIVKDRLKSELRTNGKRDVAKRIGLAVGDD